MCRLIGVILYTMNAQAFSVYLLRTFGLSSFSNGRPSQQLLCFFCFCSLEMVLPFFWYYFLFGNIKLLGIAYLTPFDRHIPFSILETTYSSVILSVQSN